MWRVAQFLMHNLLMQSAKDFSKKTLRAFNFTLLKLHRLAVRRPRTTLVLFFIFLGVMAVPLARLRMLLSIDDLIDKDFHTYQQLKDLNHDFLNQDEIYIVVRHNRANPWTKDELCDLGQWVQTTANGRGDIRAIVSTLGLLWPTETQTHFKMSSILHPDCGSSDPQTEFIAKGFAKLARSPWKGTLTSNAADDVAILIYPDARKKSDFFGTFNQKIVDELTASFRSSILAKHPNLKASWIGDGIFQYHLRKGYERMPLLNLLMSIFILLLFRYQFGTFLSGALLLTTVTWASLPVYGGMGLFHCPIDMLSSSLSLMIFVASLEDFIILSYLSRRMHWRAAFRRLLLPSFFTSLTTVIGFGSLCFANLEIVRRFGIWAATGAAMEWIVMCFVLPAVCVCIPKIRKWVKTRESPAAAPRALPAPLKWAARLSLVVFVIALAGVHSLHVSDSPEKLLPRSHPARQALRVIEKTRGWRAQMSLVFADTDDIKFNKHVEDEVRKWPLVTFIEDIYATREYLTKNLTPQMRAYLQDILDHSTVGHRLGPVGEISRAIVYLRSLDIVDVNQMREQIKTLCPNHQCWLAGTLVSYGELGERVLSTLYSSLGTSLLLVGFVLLWLCLAMQPGAFLPIFLASMWGAAALLAVFYVFHVPVAYTTSMIASILVGIAGDNSVMFLFFSDRGNVNSGIAKMGNASKFVTVSMVVASSVFFFGYFAPMRTLGLMLIGGFILVLVGDIWVLRSLLPKKN